MRNSIKMVQSACTFQSLWHESEKNYWPVLYIWGVMLDFWSLLCRNQLRWSRMCQWLNTDEKFWSHSQTPSSHEEVTSQETNTDSKKWWLYCQTITIALISTDVINTHTQLVRLKTSFRGYESPWRTCLAWFHQRQWADGQNRVKHAYSVPNTNTAGMKDLCTQTIDSLTEQRHLHVWLFTDSFVFISVMYSLLKE